MSKLSLNDYPGYDALTERERDIYFTAYERGVTDAGAWEQKYNDLLKSSRDFMKESGKYDETLESALNRKTDILGKLIFLQQDHAFGYSQWWVMLNLGNAMVDGKHSVIIQRFAEKKDAEAFRDAITIMQHPSVEATPAQLPEKLNSESSGSLIDSLKLEQATAHGKAGRKYYCEGIEYAINLIRQHHAGQYANDTNVVSIHESGAKEPINTDTLNRCPDCKMKLEKYGSRSVEGEDDRVYSTFRCFYCGFEVRVRASTKELASGIREKLYRALITEQQREIPIEKREAYDGDWLNDTTHENGNYANRCTVCGEIFNGHKRRVVCKWCADRAPKREYKPSKDFITGREIMALHKRWMDAGCPASVPLSEIEDEASK